MCLCILLSQEFSGSSLGNRRHIESKELFTVILVVNAARNINTGLLFSWFLFKGEKLNNWTVHWMIN